MKEIAELLEDQLGLVHGWLMSVPCKVTVQLQEHPITLTALISKETRTLTVCDTQRLQIMRSC